MKSTTICQVSILILMINTIRLATSTQKTRGADVLNLNGIQDGDGVTERARGTGKTNDPVTESQENRSFYKPEADRRGGNFYPSGPPLSPGLGSSSGFDPSYHTSGNGYSYGAPSGSNPDYPSPTFDGGFPTRPSFPSGSGIGQGHYGAGLGGNFPLAISGGGGHNHAMALKGLLLPIAGVALLGVAAVLAKSNPVLLQLGVVSGKRRRRSAKKYPGNPYVKSKRQEK